MRSRLLSFLLTTCWLIWAAFIVPAHTRGAISTDGNYARDGQGAPVRLFFSALPSCCQPKSPANSKSPPRSGNCAICQVVAKTGITPAISFFLCLVEASHPAPLPVQAQVASIEFLPTFQGRAPPPDLLL